MMHWTRLIALGAALLLTGCLWGPGKFTSDLTLRKDGSFVLNYRGEIVLMLPPDQAPAAIPWGDDFARCYTDGRAELMPGVYPIEATPSEMADLEENEEKRRPCTPAEIAKLKQEYERRAAEKAAAKHKENEDMAKAFGLPGLDDESNRAFAAKLMKYAGWRSVTYRGKGVYDVDYHFEGRATQDFLFPALPDNDLMIPFIAIRRRADGSVLVTAPALSGGAGPMAERAGTMGASAAGGPPPSRAEGRFTIVTDGEILTNNSEDGASANPLGRQLRWDVGPASKKIPEALIRL
jgi:hypothetical protein